MKTPLVFLLVPVCSVAFAQQPPVASRPPQPPPQPFHLVHPASNPAAPKDTANYVITVNWKDAKAGTNSLQVLTSEGSFSLDTIQSSVRINDSDIPTTVSFRGSISPLNPRKGRLKLFLGRTVPYVTSTYASGPGKASSSYQQLRVGLDSTFTVTFGKPLLVQADQNGEVSVVVKREEN